MTNVGEVNGPGDGKVWRWDIESAVRKRQYLPAPPREKHNRWR
jgi:hypothetical protein